MKNTTPIIVVLVYLVVVLAIWVTLGYVAIHFITKFW